jgi:hypothetical protein
MPAAIEAVKEISKGQSSTSQAAQSSTGQPATRAQQAHQTPQVGEKDNDADQERSGGDDRVRRQVVHAERRLDALVDQGRSQQDVLGMRPEKDFDVEPSSEDQGVPVVAEEGQVGEPREQQHARGGQGAREQDARIHSLQPGHGPAH